MQREALPRMNQKLEQRRAMTLLIAPICAMMLVATAISIKAKNYQVFCEKGASIKGDLRSQLIFRFSIFRMQSGGPTQASFSSKGDRHDPSATNTGTAQGTVFASLK